MRIPGERVRTTRLIRGGRYVVAVEVDIVIPPDAPDEPCYEAEPVQLVRKIAELAKRGDTDWLKQHGQVYELIRSGE